MEKMLPGLNNMNTEQCVAELFMMSVAWTCVLYISAGPNNTRFKHSGWFIHGTTYKTNSLIYK